jgi:hypothetical protein
MHGLATSVEQKGAVLGEKFEHIDHRWLSAEIAEVFVCRIHWK